MNFQKGIKDYLNSVFPMDYVHDSITSIILLNTKP